MDDLISRQAAIDDIWTVSPLARLDRKWVDRWLRQLPPIQPEPHTGHWEPVGMAEAVGGESAMWGSAIAYHKCSECGEQALEENGEEKLSDFCPSCGAKMEGVDDE